MTNPMTPTPSTGDGLMERYEPLAMRFHEAYERLAPQFHYTTRKASAVPWRDVPEANRRLMIATVAEIIPDTIQTLQTERNALRAGLASVLDVVDGLYRKHGVELEADEVLTVQTANNLVADYRALNSNPNTSGEAK